MDGKARSLFRNYLDYPVNASKIKIFKDNIYDNQECSIALSDVVLALA